MNSDKKLKTEDPNLLTGFIYASWKDIIPEDLRKELMAYAINDWIKSNNAVHINGYLITNNRTVLDLKIDEGQEQEQLKNLNNSVKTQVIAFVNKRDQLEWLMNDRHRLKLLREENPLRKYEVINYELKSLITGNAVKINYYNAGLEQLRNELENNPFSSSLYYQGGTGMIIMPERKTMRTESEKRTKKNN